MRTIRIGVILLGVFLFLMGIVSAIPQTFSVHGKLSNSSGAIEGTYSMNFSLYNVYSGGSPLWSDVYSVSTDSGGVYDVILSDLDLPFSEQYYLGVNVEGDGEMVPRINLSSSAYSFRAQNVSSSGIIFDSNFNVGDYNFSVGTSDFFVDADSGRVGIGTGSPGYLLDVVGSIRIRGDSDKLFFSDDTPTDQYFISYSSGFGGLNFAEYATADGRIFIKDGGNVGIGTTSPQNKLNVVGNSNVTGDAYFAGGWEDGGVSISGGDLYAQTVYTYNITSLAVNDLNINGSLIPADGFDNTFDIGSSSLRWKDGYFGGNLNVAEDGRALFDTGSAGTEYPFAVGRGPPSSALLIWGDDSSAYLLSEQDEDAGFYGNMVFQVDDDGTSKPHFLFETKSGTDLVFINGSSGNVGIGTSSPVGDLHVSSSDNSRIIYVQGDSYGIRLGSVAGVGGAIEGVDSTNGVTSFQPLTMGGSTLNFRINGSSEMFLNGLGNLGIGTMSPDAKLHLQLSDTSYSWTPYSGTTAIFESATNIHSIVSIVGTSASQSSIWFGDNDSQHSGRVRYENSDDAMELWTNELERVHIDSSGWVGIGTSSPDAKLEVIGDAVIGAEGTGLAISSDGYLSDEDDSVHINDGLDMDNHGIVDIDWSASDDGSGSGLDADLLDSHDTSYFLNSGSSELSIADTRNDGDVVPDNFTDKKVTFSFTDEIVGSANVWDSVISVKGWGDTYRVWQLMSGSSTGIGDDNLHFRTGVDSSWGTLRTVWDSGNDGSTSGLDADLWDGNQFASYLDQALLTTSNPNFNYLDINQGSDYGVRFWGGNNGYMISMGNDQDDDGTVTDYSMHFNMGATAGRGFTFGSSDTAVSASINALTGDIHSDGAITVGSTGSFGGALDMNSHKITELATPTADSDAATKAYVDAASGGLKVYKSDGTTELGDFVQMETVGEDVCTTGTLYTNGGTLTKLSSSDCVNPGTIYFTSSDCTGSTYFVSKSAGDHYLNYGTVYVVGADRAFGSYCLKSYRDWDDGQCHTTNYYCDTRRDADVSSAVCGTGDCIIK